CEAALRSLKEDDPEPQSRGHLLPSEAAATAQDAHARKLLLTHIPVADGGEWALADARSAYDGDVEIAEPLRSYEV
ncbi:MAG: MBL fold metallo-hydrolase, partial [Candidatus Limnocylindria bacterium]